MAEEKVPAALVLSPQVIDTRHISIDVVQTPQADA